MTPKPTYIVFQCYGKEAIFHECAFALLSLSRLYQPGGLSNTEIWIYTDNPGWFQSFKDCPLPLHYRQINQHTIKTWRGDIDFVHRVKIEVLKDLTKDKQGNILYTDTDVVFTHRLDKMAHDIEGGSLYMHIMEGRVNDKGNPILKKLSNYLDANNRLRQNGAPMSCLTMWNAGVLGFNTSYTPLLNEALEFTDKEYPRFPKHVVEQFAFSAAFQQAGPIKAASPYILHYWNLKEARGALASFFTAFKNDNWQALEQYSQLLQMPALMQEKVNFFQNRSIADKLLKKQWAPVKQDWRELMKQV